MRLLLTNFKCYDQLDLTMADSGITLLSGSSGNGKTTIVQAIFFALSGTGTHIVKEGEKKCSVRLQFKHLDITRTKHPQSLTLILNGSERYVEHDAQHRIHQVIGPCYELCGYIPQSYYRSFLFLSARDKLEVLKKVCFSHTHIVPEETLETIKQRLKEHQTHLNGLHGQLHVVSQLLEEGEVPSEPIVCPAPTRSPEEIRQILDQWRTYTLQRQRVELLEQRLARTEKVECTPDEPGDLPGLQRHLALLQTIHTLESERTQLTSKRWEATKEECEESLEHYTTQIQVLQTQQELRECIARLETIETTYTQLVNEKERIREAPEALYECPSCQCPVYVSNDQLYPVEDAHTNVLTTKRDELDRVEKQLKKLEGKVYELERSRQQMKEIETRMDSYTLDECKEYTAYFRSILTDIQYTATALKNVERQLSRSRAECVLDLTLQETQTRLALEQQKAQERDTLRYKHQQYAALVNEVDTARRALPAAPCDDEAALHQQLDAHREYEAYCVALKRYQQYTSTRAQQRRLQQQVEETEQRILRLQQLKKIVLKTETEFVETQMDRLSHHVNALATALFHEPIRVEFKAFKDSDKIAPSVRVYYKNMYCDVDRLSGGEVARLNLCFIMAFALFFQTPLLMLDECTANLDAELVEQVIEQLNTTSIPKIVLIAHQIVEGEVGEVLKIPI